MCKIGEHFLGCVEGYYVAGIRKHMVWIPERNSKGNSPSKSVSTALFLAGPRRIPCSLPPMPNTTCLPAYLALQKAADSRLKYACEVQVLGRQTCQGASQILEEPLSHVEEMLMYSGTSLVRESLLTAPAPRGILL